MKIGKVIYLVLLTAYIFLSLGALIGEVGKTQPAYLIDAWFPVKGLVILLIPAILGYFAGRE